MEERGARLDDLEAELVEQGAVALFDALDTLSQGLKPRGDSRLGEKIGFSVAALGRFEPADEERLDERGRRDSVLSRRCFEMRRDLRGNPYGVGLFEFFSHVSEPPRISTFVIGLLASENQGLSRAFAADGHVANSLAYRIKLAT